MAAAVVAVGLHTIVMVVWWLCVSLASVAVMMALPQYLPLAVNVPSALWLLPTIAQWCAPVPTSPALLGLTVKQTFCPTGLGSPFVFGSTNTTEH